MARTTRIGARALTIALNRSGGSAAKAAVLLGVSERTVYRLIKRYGIEVTRRAQLPAA